MRRALFHVFIGTAGILAMTSCNLMGRREEPQVSSKTVSKTVAKPTPSVPQNRKLQVHSPRNPLLLARLKSLENSTMSSKELEQYSKALPYMKSDEERLKFLELDGFESRQTWLQNQDFPSRPANSQDEMKELVETQDIAIGMPQALVKRSWGDPDSVEVSGNPQFRNEKWKYNKYVSSSEGYKMEKKTVFFEGGKVIGWEVD